MSFKNVQAKKYSEKTNYSKKIYLVKKCNCVELCRVTTKTNLKCYNHLTYLQIL